MSIDRRPVVLINDLARRHGYYPDLLPGQQPYVNFTIKELHEFANDLLDATLPHEYKKE